MNEATGSKRMMVHVLYLIGHATNSGLPIDEIAREGKYATLPMPAIMLDGITCEAALAVLPMHTTPSITPITTWSFAISQAILNSHPKILSTTLDDITREATQAALPLPNGWLDDGIRGAASAVLPLPTNTTAITTRTLIEPQALPNSVPDLVPASLL